VTGKPAGFRSGDPAKQYQEGVNMLSNNKRSNNNQSKNSNITGQANNQKNRPQKENVRANISKRNSKNEFQKKSSQRYNSESVVSRIANPRREETIEDIRMDIEKLEKEIQFEIKQIRSIKLGL